ncbi:MAG: hypothetical protein M3N18_07145 [Actinomycetota bacterium]|nr:hypothetical protein [Actinomycetota bacterium]
MNPEDMSGGTGLPGGADQVPEAWVGRRVEVRIIVSGGWTSSGHPYPLRGESRVGDLEGVNELGIIATLSDGEVEPTPGVFYPWGAVLSMQLEGE